jgi:hypothetical protein
MQRRLKGAKYPERDFKSMESLLERIKDSI